jgi:hypothetical protein
VEEAGWHMPYNHNVGKQLCYMMNPPKLLNNHHRRYVGKKKEIIQTQ